MASSTTNVQLELQPGRQKRQRTRKSPADKSKHRRSRKRVRVADATDEFYSVKSILDESSDKYLIDWEDDPGTGRTYSPTWEPKVNANHIAIEHWEKGKRRQGDEPQRQIKRTDRIDSSSDSEPIRTSKRKRTLRVAREIESSNSSSELATKRRRLGASIRQVRRTSLSHGEGLEKDEIEDSFEGGAEISPIRISNIQVAIPFHASIDTSAYANAASDSTQPSLSVNSPINLQSSPDIREVFDQNFTEAEIADSQDIPTFGKKLPESQNTTTTQSTTSSKGSNSGLRDSEGQNNSLITRPYLSTNDGNLEYSGENSTHSHPKHTTASDVISSIADTQSCISWLTVKPFSIHRSSVESEHQATSGTSKDSQKSDSQPLRVEYSLLAQQRGSDERGSIVTTLSHSGSKQTLPPVDLEIPETQEEINFLADRLLSTSGSEEIWQGAQVISPDNSLPTFRVSSERLNFEIFQDTTASPAREEYSQDSTGRSILSQQDGNSTKSFSQPKEPDSRSQDLPVHNNCHSQSSISIHSQRTLLSTANTEHRPNEEASDFGSFLPPHLVPSSGLPDLPDSYGSNIPPRPRPLSYSDMSGGQDSMELEATSHMGIQGLSVREQMRLRRAETAASRPISVARTHSDSPAASGHSSMPSIPAISSVPVLPSVPTVPSTRSASLTPARVPSPLLPAAQVNQMAVQSNQMLPNRGVTVPTPHLSLNPRTGHNGPVKEEKDAGVTHSTELPRLGAMEYIVPLPMMSTIRKVYEGTIRNNKHEIQEFTSNETSDPQLVLKMEKMIDTLKKLGDHQDIDTGVTPSQADMSDDTIRKWAETCSTKCAFVRELLDALRPLDVHVAILARPGRMLDILEAIFRSQKYIYERPDQLGKSGQNSAGHLRVTLLPTGDDGRQYTTMRADMVIAFDETFRSGEKYSGILRSPRSGHQDMRQLSPLISLVVANSAEHLELCIPQPPSKSRERTQALVNAIVERRHEVGKIDVDDFQPNQAAARVARYLISFTSGFGDPAWPLPPIDDIGIDFTGMQFRPDSSTPFSNHVSGHMQVPLVPRSSTKRSWDDSDTTDSDINKRARSTPVPGETNASLDVSRVSDTVGSQSQMRPGATLMGENSGSSGVKSEYHDLIAHNAALLAQVAALSSKVTDLESQLLSKQQAISNLYNIVKDRDHSMEVNIAPKYQQAIKESADARTNLKAVSERNEALLKRAEQRDTEIQKLKEEKTTMQTELNAARTAMSGSAIPEVAELGKKDEEIRSLRETIERQEKKTASAEKLVEFVREEYQKASTAAADANNELSTKDAIIADLSRKADDNRVICAQAQAASEREESDLRISELEALLQDREDELVRKREELKVRSSRRETRGVSVPRSPAIMPSPRVVGSRSRAGSPAVGELGRERDAGDSILGARTRRIGQLLSSEREGG